MRMRKRGGTRLEGGGLGEKGWRIWFSKRKGQPMRHETREKGGKGRGSKISPKTIEVMLTSKGRKR